MQDRQAATRWIEEQYDPMVETLSGWCRQNSSSLDAEALHSMADLLIKDFEPLSIQPEQIDLPSHQKMDDRGHWVNHATGPILRWDHNRGADHRLLLMIHYDTVYASDVVGTAVSVDGNRMIGPGTVDAKGGIAVIRWAAEAVRRFELDRNIGWTIVLNPDEEIGSPSSRPVWTRWADEFEFGLLFEPSLPDGSFVADRKGSGNFLFVVHGRSAHAGRDPSAGRNAIELAARMVSELAALPETIPGIQLNVGQFVSKGPLNRVPDLAIIELNVRAESKSAVAKTLAAMDRIATRHNNEDGFGCKWHGGFHAPPKIAGPKDLALRHTVERAAVSVGRQVRWQDTGGACDGCALAAAGLPNVDTMGLTGNHLHSPNEYCDLGSWAKAVETVVEVIHKFSETVSK